jgi:hypothetical protein
MGPISRAQLRKRPGDYCLASNFSLSTSVILRIGIHLSGIAPPREKSAGVCRIELLSNSSAFL